MKIMLWSLLALNGVAALLWMAGVTVPTTARPQAPPPALAAQRLELLSELPVPPARLAESDDELPPSIAPTDGPTPAIAPDTPQADAAAPSDAPVAATGAAGGEVASSPVADVESPVESVTPPAPQAAPPPADVAQNLDRLLQQHANEWSAFTNDLGSGSFVRQWIDDAL